MSILSRIKGALTTASEPMEWAKLSPDQRRSVLELADTKEYQYIERIAGIKVNRFEDFNSYLVAGSKKVWASFRACHITACVFVKTPFKAVFKGEEDDQLARYSELSRLMEEPNRFDSWEDLAYQLVFHLMLTGNCYWLKDNMNFKGQPAEIYALLPQYVYPIADARDRVSKYEYRVNGKVIEFAPNEIIHFRRMSPRDSVMGIGDIEGAEPLFSEFINTDEFRREFLKNGAQPSGVLTREEEVQDESMWRKFVNEVRTKYEGKKNVGRTMMLHGKWTYQQLGFSMQQMQQIEKEKMTVEQIFLSHGVPLSVAGFGASNYATARQDDINFRKYQVVPLLDIFVGKLNRKDGLCRPFDDRLRITYSLAGLIDIEQVIKDYGPMVDRGAMTPNELREMAGLARVDDPLMDAFYVNSGMMPLEMAGLADPGMADLKKISERLKTS